MEHSGTLPWGLQALANCWQALRKAPVMTFKKTRKKAALRSRAAFSIKTLDLNGQHSDGIAALAIGHLLRHEHDQLAILILNFAQQTPKLVEKAGFLTGRAPRNVVRRLALRQVRQLRRFLTVIKELIKWALERARELLQSLDGWDSVAIFNSGDITAK
ncbi:MAG TPA: hypothetical protein VJP87_07035 [Candidatus Acidoferrales bacterium]|nr:hypothetical protein [Candidatus Acidoferrales bacterium]